MKFRVERDVLADAAAWVARSLPARPPVPVLGGVLLEATSGPSGDRLTVSGFDYETSARVELDATIGDPGRVLVSGRLLADITKALPAKPVDVVVDGARATISCGNSRFSLPTMPVEDYPQLPAMPQVAGIVPGDVLAQAVQQVAVAAGRDDTLPMLTGIRLEIDGPRLTLAATDRFRLAVRELEWSPEDAGADHVGADPGPHPRRRREDARRRGPGRAGAVGGRRHARHHRWRPPGDHAPARRRVPAVPPAHPDRAHQRRDPRVRRARRGDQARRSSSRTGSPRCAWSSATTGCACPRAATRSAAPRRSSPCELDGAPLTIAFNPGYLLDALGALHTPRARLTFTTPNRPALMRPVPPPSADAGSSDGEAAAEHRSGDW